jgi:hypothetical protein
MTPIPRNLIVYKGITFTFFFILRDDLSSVATFTADDATNVITTGSAHGLAIGDPVVFINEGGFLPAPLQTGIDYFVLTIPTTTTFTFSTEYLGLEFDIQAAGTGTNTLWTKRAIDLTSWGVWAYVRDRIGGTMILDLAPDLSGATSGKVDLSMTDSETYVLDAGHYFWDLILQNPAGERLGPLFAGTFNVIHLITDPAP